MATRSRKKARAGHEDGLVANQERGAPLTALLYVMLLVTTARVPSCSPGSTWVGLWAVGAVVVILLVFAQGVLRRHEEGKSEHKRRSWIRERLEECGEAIKACEEVMNSDTESGRPHRDVLRVDEAVVKIRAGLNMA